MGDIVVSLTISNPALIAGVEFARAAYNASLPEVQDTYKADIQLLDAAGKPAVDEAGAPILSAKAGDPMVDANGAPVYITPKPGTLSNEEYIIFVGTSAVKSYAQQKVQSDFNEGLINKKDRDAYLAALK
jgi:hypothetical protein